MKKRYRTTIVRDGSACFIPVPFDPKVVFGKVRAPVVVVELELDTRVREVAPPRDLVVALRAAPPAWDRWRELSFTHQREHVEAIEGAKRPETRARRIANAVAALRGRPSRRTRV